jgi:hypothetical protein
MCGLRTTLKLQPQPAIQRHQPLSSAKTSDSNYGTLITDKIDIISKYEHKLRKYLLHASHFEIPSEQPPIYSPYKTETDK